MSSKILVVDRSDSLANSVRHAIGILRSGSDVVSCNRVGEVADVVTQDGPFDVLVAGPALMTRAGLARLAALPDHDPSISVVLVSPRSPDVHLKDVVRTGAVDLVSSPVHAGDLVDAIERALDQRRQLALPAVASESASGPAPAPHMVTTLTVSSATGGCGKTFYVTNLAYFLAHHTR